MDPHDKARLTAQAEVFKALAHPSRLAIVQELANGERCGCELTNLVGADKSTVSKHLAILKRTCIIRDEKRGTMVFYSLQARCVLEFLDCVEGMLARTAQESLALHG